MTNTLEPSPARRFDRTVRLRWATVLVLGAPLLGGCAASHVGNAWQCPLVQGRPCVSVAGADPAAPGQGSSPVRGGHGGRVRSGDGNAAVPDGVDHGGPGCPDRRHGREGRRDKVPRRLPSVRMAQADRREPSAGLPRAGGVRFGK